MRDEEGFTLIELVTVVLIISILIAVSIPSFARAKDRAQDRVAQQALTDGGKALLIIGFDSGLFPSTSTLLTEVALLEPRFTWRNHQDPSTAPDELSLDMHASGSEVEVAARSSSGTCFYLRAKVAGRTEYHQSDSAPCTGHWFQGIAATGW